MSFDGIMFGAILLSNTGSLEIVMQIEPTTLRALREKKGLSQQGLADLSKISKRQIARIESGGTGSERMRQHTVESLAKALRVDRELLCMPVTDEAVRQALRHEAGHQDISARIDPNARANYWLVEHHYKVPREELINAAPWMFALLAEMSLADRRRRLDELNAAFEAAQNCIPDHLQHACVAIHGDDFSEAYADEEESLSKRDIFGDRVLETAVDGPAPFDPDETNPFVEFIGRIARKLDSEAIDQAILPDDESGMPTLSIFKSWLDELTGGDEWARFALVEGGVRLADMPDELKPREPESADRTLERAKWLVEQIPPDLREREEQRRKDEQIGSLRLEDLA